jgi:Protein of unknown function (DUF3632)
MVLSSHLLESRISFSTSFRRDIDANINPTDINNLSETARMLASSLTRRAVGRENEIVLTEWDLHDLWYIYIQLAMATDAEGLRQDRLVVQILGNKGLQRLVSQGDEEVTTSDGVLWDELPFLGRDLLKAFTLTDLNPAQCTNLAAFTGKLVASSASDSVYDSALWILTTTLEETDQPTEATLLSALTLLRRCVHKLLVLALHPPNSNFAPGQQAAANGVETAGFSLARWKFWKKRLEGLKDGENENLKQYGRRGFLMMDSAEKDLRLSK